jgi:hypothetical protein
MKRGPWVIEVGPDGERLARKLTPEEIGPESWHGPVYL